MKVYFLAYNLMNTSTGDYFISLSNKLSETNKVVVIAAKIRKTNLILNSEIIVLTWPTQKLNTWKNFKFLRNAVSKYKPDLMLSIFSFVNLFLVVGYIKRVKVRGAWIRTLSAQYSQEGYKVLRKKLIYSLATHVLVNSKATKIDVISFFKIPDNKISILPNSVKDYSLALDEIEVNKNKLLYVGRLHPTKGLFVLIHGFSQLLKKCPGLQLDIIGQGSIQSELVELAEELGISENIFFLGEQNKQNVLKAYKESYCTIIPSHYEAFGFTVIEAMSVGTCVIGANNTGIKEIIIHEETGLLFETGNSNDLYKQMERIVYDERLRNKLAHKGYQRFLKYYENSISINRDVKFFNSINN